MDHALMIICACSAIGLYVHAVRRKEPLHSALALHRVLQVLCIVGCFWLGVYAVVELARSTIVWMSGHAGGNIWTALILGGSIAINMNHPWRQKPPGQRMEGA